MWKSRKDDERPPTSVKPPTASSFFGSPIASPKENISMEPVKSFDRNDVAHIGKSVLIKGELSGSEDLFLDGEVEGKVELRGHALTIGPNGRVKANVNARPHPARQDRGQCSVLRARGAEEIGGADRRHRYPAHHHR